MSYNVCLNCETMVLAYEKYCDHCEKVSGFANDKDYWQNNRWPIVPGEREKILYDDKQRGGFVKPNQER